MNQQHRVIEHIQALMQAQNALIQTLLDGVGDQQGQQTHAEDQLELPFAEPPPP